MKLNIALATVALTGLLATACGGSDSAGSGSLNPTSLNSYCENLCDREADCDPGTDWAGCVNSCNEDGSVIRGDVFTDYYSCMLALPCGANDDSCEPTTIQPLAIHAQYQDACETRFTECGAAPTDIAAFCGTDGTSEMSEMLPLVASDVTQELIGCLDVACTDIDDCLDALLDL
jgi:hypothetical protein